MEALVGLACAHGDAFELFEFAEEVFDEVAPFVHLLVDIARRDALWPLRDDDLGAALVEFGDDPVGVEGLVAEQGIELDPVDERRYTDRVVAIAGKQFEAHQVAQGIGEHEDLGRPPAFGLAYGLILSPPFAPCP